MSLCRIWSAWSPVSSKALSPVLSLGLCCLCSSLLLLLMVGLALVLLSVTQDQFAKSFLVVLGTKFPSYVLTLSVGATITRFFSGCCATGRVCSVSHPLTNLCPHPFATLVHLAREKMPLPLPKVKTLR